MDNPVRLARDEGFTIAAVPDRVVSVRTSAGINLLKMKSSRSMKGSVMMIVRYSTSTRYKTTAAPDMLKVDMCSEP